jgi:four helix bundle protein
MATFKKFEDIKAWQKARQANKLIYKISARGEFAQDFALKDQIHRASISTMGNIAEGFGRRSNKEFANFLNIAHGSATEAQSHLYVALDVDYIEQNTFDKIYELLEEVLRMIVSLIQHLQADPKRTL